MRRIREKAIRYVSRVPGARLLVITNMWPEPDRLVYGICIKRQVEGLEAAGVRCDVVYLRGFVGKWTYAIAAMWLFASRWRIGRRYQAIHVHTGEMAVLTRTMLGGSMIATFHGDDILGYTQPDGSRPWRSKVRSAVILFFARFFSGTVTQSREMERQLPERARARNRVIPCGVDTVVFSPHDTAEARSWLRWDSERHVVLFAATRPYVPLKRLDLAEAVVSRAAGEVGDVELFVAKNLAPATMPLLMSAADCLLVTSTAEGGPQVVKEAAMCNLPVVSTDVGDVGEVLSDIDPSEVCDDDVDALSGALATILRSRERSNGRRKKALFDESQATARLMEMYGDLGLIDVQQTG
jgi:glycosyltransferase involved in cell wall biosynthesis